MAKIIALLSIIWLATAYGKKAAPKLDIKLEPESESPFEIPDWDDVGNGVNGTSTEVDDFRGGGGGGFIRQTKRCACRKVIWGTSHIPNINNQCSRKCKYWWLNGKKDTREVMIVKVTVSTRVTFYFRVKSSETILHWCQAKKKRGNKYVCQGPWQGVPLVQIDKYLYSSIIQWESEKGFLWGFVSANGLITCHGRPDQLIYFIDRMFINYLIKTWVVARGYTVIEYKLYWRRKWHKYPVPLGPDQWLIPTWISIEQRRIWYKVVTYIGQVHVVYIGPNLNEGIMEIIIWTNKKTFRFRVRIDTVYIYWCRRVSGKWKKWVKIKLVDISHHLKLSIVRWQTIQGEWMTGLANVNGDIIAFAQMMELYRLTINRLYLQFFMLKYVIERKYKIKRYRIIWEGKVIVFTKKIVVTELLIPKWLPKEQCRVVWKVVKVGSKVVIIYVGGEVSGPMLLDCKDDENKDKCEFVVETETTIIDIPAIIFPEIIEVPDTCGLFNENGRCVDVINPDGYCTCKELCTCIDPFDLYRENSWGDPIFPGPLIPGGIIPGSCSSGFMVGPSCPPAGPGWPNPPIGPPPGPPVIPPIIPPGRPDWDTPQSWRGSKGKAPVSGSSEEDQK